MSYFFDTYALVEIIKNNPNYEKFISFPIVTTTLNLSEFYFYLLSNLNKELADGMIGKFNFSFLEIDKDAAIEAAKFRKINYKRKLSYIDCIGYVLAKNKSFKFLTGDDFFEALESVEFVK